MATAPTLPILHIFPDSVDGMIYHQAMRNGQVTWIMAVQGVVASGDQESQEKLDRWLEPTGDESVFAAIESDTTLGGVAMDTTVTGVSAYQEYVSPSTGNLVIACTWRVEVMTTG